MVCVSLWVSWLVRFTFWFWTCTLHTENTVESNLIFMLSVFLDFVLSIEMNLSAFSAVPVLQLISIETIGHDLKYLVADIALFTSTLCLEV